MSKCYYEQWNMETVASWRAHQAKGYIVFTLKYGFMKLGLPMSVILSLIFYFFMPASLFETALDALITILINVVGFGFTGMVYAHSIWRTTESSFIEMERLKKE